MVWGRILKKRLLCGAAVAALLSAGSGHAADIAPASTASRYNWNGFYGGFVTGAAWGRYETQTTTSGTFLSSEDIAAVNAASVRTIKPTGFAAGLEGGYNWQIGNFLLGIEADLQAIHLNGVVDNTVVPSATTPGNVFTTTAYGNTDWLFTARPRIGFVGPSNWLFYATGGLALTRLQTDFTLVDSLSIGEAGRINKLVAGYAVGGGVEAPLTDRLSIKADYLHVAFPNAANAEIAAMGVPPSQTFGHSSSLSADMVRAGLNYHFWAPDPGPHGASTLPLKAPPVSSAPTIFQNWQFETGARLWLSNGQEQEGPLFNAPPLTLASRLVYGGLEGVSGETFFRADHGSGLFIKGNLGAGALSNGHMNDEDFPAGVVYSNTLSRASGHLAYGTIDVGYDVFNAPGARLGAFVGYNRYKQGINTYGCTQLAGDATCSFGIPANTMGITEYDYFDSLRIGLASQVMLSDRLRLTAEAAYLTAVNYKGLDNHLWRQLLGPDASNKGNGMMLEAMVDYYVTPNWTVGVGGRYWAWNMDMGTAGFDSLSLPPTPVDVQPSRYSAERYGVFVQTAYHWGETNAPRTAGMPTKAPALLAAGPVNWTGFYVGGHLGGGVSNIGWSDPFDSTVDPFGNVNVAGFGDKTRAPGALGGGQIGGNWQTGHWVLGGEVAASLADLRGENTCFSGLGGLNCQHVVNSLGSVTGRAGYTFDRSLAYVKAGGAWIDTSYNLFGDTFGVRLGDGSTHDTAWGWTAGVGLEYALTNRWTTFAEYDHIGLPSRSVPFPTVAVVSDASISVRQSVDLFKMGVNYRFDFGPATTIAARD